MKELWDLYDENRKPLNKTHIRGDVLKMGEYHIVVDIWVINDDGKILIAKRHPSKHLGGLWECQGGSIIKGESSIEGAKREVEEEIGLKLDINDFKLIHSIKLEDRFVDTYVVKTNIDLRSLVLQQDEVVDVRLVSLDELIKLADANMLAVKERLNIYKTSLEKYDYK